MRPEELSLQIIAANTFHHRDVIAGALERESVMSGPSNGKLTAKQQMFCEIYVETGNATEAYRRAYDVGKSTKANTIEKQACELLKNWKVSRRIAELESLKAGITESVAERMETSIERTLEELARIAYANIADYVRIDNDGLAYVDLSKTSRAKLGAIQELTVDEITGGRSKNAPLVVRTKLKLMDKKGALVELLNHLVEAKSKKADDRPEDLRPRSPGEDHLAELQALYGGALAGKPVRH